MSAHLHDHPFKFYRVRGGSEERIYPHAGARLHFGSREADSLSLPTLPVGTLAAGDQVKVTYTPSAVQPSTSNLQPRTVFLGTVEKRVLRATGGSEQTETVTVLGPWSKMARLVYRQGWASMGATARSSRLILNQTKAGTPQTLNSELAEIANHAAEACGYEVGTVSVSTQVLPSDECRDITVADAIRRELRLFPKAVARFDYSSGTPVLIIEKPSSVQPSTSDLNLPLKAEREIEYDEHPITGVDLEIAATGEIDGVSYLDITHQTAGDTGADNPDCLYATLQIRGASFNVVRQSFKSVTEDPSGSWQSADWWKQKHPRLANVATSALTLSDVQCDGSGSLPTDCPRISAATAGELEEAGLKCRVCKFTAKATIETTDDKEEEVYLTMHFLMTNAEGTAANPKTYTWVSESSAESGETVPPGLARTILAERCGSIRSEKMTVRLGETFPTIGDVITDDGETLPLQSVDIDCADLTADLVFGAPEYLSPEDMAALLSNFRNKRTTTSSSLRKTGKTEDQGSNVEMGGIPPLSSTEFQPGTKSHTTIKSASGGSGSINLDSSDLKSGETAEMKPVTGGGQGDAKVVSTKPIAVIGGKGIEVSANGGTIKVTANPDKKDDDPEPTGEKGNPCDHPGNDSQGGDSKGGSGGGGVLAGGFGGGGGLGGGGGSGGGGGGSIGDTGGGGDCSGCGRNSTTGGSGSGSPEPGADGKPAEGATGGGASAPGKEVTTPPSSGTSGTASGSSGKEIRPGSMEATMAKSKTPIYTGTHKALTDTKKMNESPFKSDPNWKGGIGVN